VADRKSLADCADEAAWAAVEAADDGEALLMHALTPDSPGGPAITDEEAAALLRALRLARRRTREVAVYNQQMRRKDELTARLVRCGEDAYRVKERIRALGIPDDDHDDAHAAA
jgi:hypothetical protein